MNSRFLVSEDSNSFQKRHIQLLKITLTGKSFVSGPRIPFSLALSDFLFRSQIALTGMTAKPMASSNDSEEGVKHEIDATPKKRRKKTKDIETPSRKKVKKTSVKTEITE